MCTIHVHVYWCTIHICVPVSKWRDDKSVSVPQVFIAELELGITDVNITVSGFIIPAMA